MGCGGSKPAPQPAAAPPPAQPVEGQMVSGGVAPAAGQSKGKGKGKRGKGSGGTCWQIKLGDKWQDYEQQENMILKRAYMTGRKDAKFHLRGQNYEYNFKKMLQKNKDTKKERHIRPPTGPKPPSKPILPQGPMIILTVKAGQPGTMIPVKDPNNPGTTIQVFVPAHAKVGQKLAVPIPAKGESVSDVSAKQEKHDAEHKTKTAWSTGAKVAAGGAAVAGVAAIGVGGVILGDHLAGGEMAGTIGEAAVDASEWAADAGGDAGEWLEGAGGEAGEWIEGAGEDIGDFAGDAGDWLGDAGEDIGDFVMDLF